MNASDASSKAPDQSPKNAGAPNGERVAEDATASSPSTTPDPTGGRAPKRDLVSIDDFSTAELLELFQLADAMRRDLRAWTHLCPGFILATLFYEASTRTRLSFESAMRRLGGGVITAADMSTSSAAKGESLADTVRVVAAYADVIVLRHPSEGSAKIAAHYGNKPVVNAGDGSHEHPTQTICDLYSLYVEKGHLDGLNVVLCGDLKYSRTIHSFAYALARFRANIVCVPHPGLEIPEYVLERLERQYRQTPQNVSLRDFRDVSKGADVVYCTPERPHQLSLFTEFPELDVPSYDALYVTRAQVERHESDAGQRNPYLRIEPGSLRGSKFHDTSLMHPLPRTDEIAYELDEDPRAIYFKQAERGVPIRMAILAVLLGRLQFKNAQPPTQEIHASVPSGTKGMRCLSRTCICNTEHGYLQPRFTIESRQPIRVRCAYCEIERPVSFVGCLSTRRFHRHNSAQVKRIHADRLVFFDTDEEALAAGFRPSRSQ